jgi:hypothetical protein
MEFDRLLQRLLEHKIDFVLVGGFAAILHGAVVVTQDIDICLKFSRENLTQLAAALADLHPCHRLTPDQLPLEVTNDNWHSLKNIYLKTDWGVLDCLGEVSGIGPYDQACALSTQIALPIGVCRVLTIEALIQAKEAMARPHDLRTALLLKAILGKRNG